MSGAGRGHGAHVGVVLALALGAAVWLALFPALALALAYLGPALLIFALLCAGRYPGERLLLRRSARAAARLRPAPALGARRRNQAELPRGGRLIACSLGRRAPPFGPATSAQALRRAPRDLVPARAVTATRRAHQTRFTPRRNTTT